MRNKRTDKVTEFGGAARRRFHAISEKPEGGAHRAPPPGIGLNSATKWLSRISENCGF